MEDWIYAFSWYSHNFSGPKEVIFGLVALPMFKRGTALSIAKMVEAGHAGVVVVS